MPVIWTPADNSVLEIANRYILLHHRHLLDTDIGFSFRSETQESGGRLVIGQASKVSEKFQALMNVTDRVDFQIWVAKDWWDDADDAQREALIDHELCHIGPGGKLRSHDIEEFHAIVDRHGLWDRDLRQFGRIAAAKQAALPGIDAQLEHTGSVKAVQFIPN